MRFALLTNALDWTEFNLVRSKHKTSDHKHDNNNGETTILTLAEFALMPNTFVGRDLRTNLSQAELAAMLNSAGCQCNLASGQVFRFRFLFALAIAFYAHSNQPQWTNKNRTQQTSLTRSRFN